MGGGGGGWERGWGLVLGVGGEVRGKNRIGQTELNSLLSDFFNVKEGFVKILPLMLTTVTYFGRSGKS